MALQTRFAELFLGAKRPASADPLEPCVPESVSALRASAPPKPASRMEAVPRVSMTQFRGEHLRLDGLNDGASPACHLGNGEVWEHAAGTEAVNWWLNEGSGNAGSRALDSVMTQLGENNASAERWERIGEVRAVVAEFTPMLTAIALPAIQLSMVNVGLTMERLSDLRTLTLAFIQLEAPGAALETEVVSLVEQACAVRAELVAACAWNLRASRDVGSLARITDSTHAVELALDLTELADLVSGHPTAFLGDHSLAVMELGEHAATLACKLRTYHLQSSGWAGHEWGLRTQVFSLLMDCATEVRTAGCYALRHRPHWARLFGPVRNVSRRRSRLRDSLVG